jgi:hypothetical protein
MAEHKPKQDDQLIGDQLTRDAKANKPGLSRPTKPHGDKLKDAVEEAANRVRKER